MTNRKQGTANYDNDQHRKLAAGQEAELDEKGSTMERGTAHEFSTEPVSDAGAKEPKADDERLTSHPDENSSLPTVTKSGRPSGSDR